MPLGSQLVAGQPRDAMKLPVSGLEKHCVVLAGAGSGKTVWLTTPRRRDRVVRYSVDRDRLCERPGDF